MYTYYRQQQLKAKCARKNLGELEYKNKEIGYKYPNKNAVRLAIFSQIKKQVILYNNIVVVLPYA